MSGGSETDARDLADIMREGLAVARGGDPAACAEPMAGHVRMGARFRAEGDFAGLKITIDEPVSFGGQGEAPNPAEAMLAGLAASVMVTTQCHAALMGLTIERLSVDVSGALDIRGFFDADPAIRAGFKDIDLRLHFDCDAPAEKLRELRARVERGCPVLDAVRAPTPVRMAWPEEAPR